LERRERKFKSIYADGCRYWQFACRALTPAAMRASALPSLPAGSEASGAGTCAEVNAGAAAGTGAGFGAKRFDAGGRRPAKTGA